MISATMFDRRWLASGKLMCRPLTFPPRGPVKGTLVNPARFSHLQECRWNEGQATPSLCVIEAREDGNWQTRKVFSRCLQPGGVAKQLTNSSARNRRIVAERLVQKAVSITASVLCKHVQCHCGWYLLWYRCYQQLQLDFFLTEI